MPAGFSIGQYYPGDSLMHRTDPRVKLVLVFAYTFAVFLIENFTGFIPMALMIVLLIILGRLPVQLVTRGLKPLLYILIFTFIVHLWTSGGPRIDIGPASISAHGLREGTFVSVRLVLLIIGASFLTLTSTPIELNDGTEFLLSPLKRIGVPVHEIAMMVTIALRFIPILAVEVDKVVKAQSARGARFESANPIIKARSYIPILIPLFLGVFRRADELAEAMEARAYRGGHGRTRMRQLTIRKHDFVVLLVMVLLFAGMVWIGRLPVI